MEKNIVCAMEQYTILKIEVNLFGSIIIFVFSNYNQYLIIWKNF